MWSKECTAALHEYVAAGFIHVQIAELLNERFGTNYNKSSVCKKLSRLKQPKLERRDASVFWPAPMKARFTELYNEENSKSFTDIADILNKEFGSNYSRAAVIGQARRLGLSGKKPASSSFRKHPTAVSVVAIRIARDRGLRPEPFVCRPAADIKPRHLSILDLEPDDCRFPYGEGPITFCGHVKQSGSSYCPAHFLITRGEGTGGERAAHRVTKRMEAAA